MRSDFLDYYGMTLDPFQGDAGQIFCPVGGRGELLEQALQMAEYAEMVPVIVGPAKSGKSTILRELYKQLKADHQVVMLPAKRFAEQMDSIDNWLADAFGLQGYAHAGRALLGYVNDQDHPPLVLIDDANALDEMSVALLTKLRQSGLRLVLSRDQKYPLANTVLPLYELALTPMDVQECTRYLGEYFKAAGVPEGVPLDNKTLARLALASSGWPGRLNAGVRQHLLDSVGKQEVTRNIPWPHLGAGAAVLALIIVSFVWQFSKVDPEPVPVAIELESTPVVAEQPPIEPSQTLQEKLAAAAKQLEEVQQVEAPVEVFEEPQVTLSPEVVQSREPEQASDNSVVAEVVVASPVLGTSTERPLVESASAENTVIQAGQQSETVAQSSPQGVVQAAPTISAGDYRIQFFGSWDRQSAQTTLDQQQGLIPLYVQQTERDGKAWYVVLTEESYQDRNTALAAIEALPAALKELGPWARRQ